MANIYTPLDASKKEIRLILIEPSNDWDSPISCTMSRHCLQNAPPFQALSYVWGDPHNTVTITVDGCAVAATTNLVAFLRELRHRSSKGLHQRSLPDAHHGTLRALWVDAICIDLSNITERNDQVLLMGQIYSQADVALAWLGESWGASSQAMSFLHYLAKVLVAIPESSSPPVPWHELSQLCFAEDMCHENFNTIWFSVQRLLDREYWSRAWTFQEMIIPACVRLMCGSATCDLSHIVFAGCWLWDNSTGDCPAGIERRVWTTITQTRDYLEELRNIRRARFQYRGRPGKDLDHECTAWPHPDYDWDILLPLRGKKATLAHDAIYAFLAITRLPILPDYNQPIDQLYLSVAKLGVQCKRLEVVLCCAAKIEGDNPSVHTPSWVSEWLPTKQGCPGTFLERFIDIYNANAHFSAPKPPIVDANGHLILSGKVYDFIRHIGPISKPFGISEQVVDILRHYEPTERYVTGIPPLQAVLRTILCDHNGRGLRLHTTARRNHDVFMKVVILALAEDLQSISDHSKGATARLNSLLGLPTGKNFANSYANAVLDEDSHVTIGNSYEEILTPFLNDLIQRDGEEDEIGEFLSAQVDKTRLFLTKQGYLGTAPSSVQMGDCVVLSPHSRLPVVLRKRGSIYQNIGPCFILGLMDGEGLTNEGECQTLVIA